LRRTPGEKEHLLFAKYEEKDEGDTWKGGISKATGNVKDSLETLKTDMNKKHKEFEDQVSLIKGQN
jgi:hypothetical protein